MALTQREWSAALCGAWAADRSVAYALARAHGCLPGEQPTHNEWEAMRLATVGLTPDLTKVSKRMQGVTLCQVRGFMATHCRFASDALWDGDPQRAVGLVGLGGRRANSSKAAVGALSPEQRAARRLARQTVYIKARELTKGSDWHTVK